MKVGMLSGIRHIMSGYSVKQILVRGAEEYLWWFIRSLPGFEGVVLRYLFLKCTTKRLDGFCWISQGCTIANSLIYPLAKNLPPTRTSIWMRLGESKSAITPESVPTQ